MKHKDLVNLHWFCLSVQAGGFAAASRKNTISAPTLSRAVDQLEKRLGEKLVFRNAKHFALTNAGQECFQKFSPIFNHADETWWQLANVHPELTGNIRISCPSLFADHFLNEIAIDFMAKHEGVSIQISFATEADDFYRDQIDLAVSVKPAVSQDLVQKQLMSVPLTLVAAPDYLESFGEPSSLDDLQHHHLLVGNNDPYWTFFDNGTSIQVPIKPRFSSGKFTSVIGASRAGLGICMVPRASVTEYVKQGSLHQVLTEFEPAKRNLYLLWHDQRVAPHRVIAFKNEIFERLEQFDQNAFLSELVHEV